MRASALDMIATTPRRDGLLFLDLTLGANERAADVADFLYATWHERPAMRVDGTPLLEWLATPLSHVGTEGGKPLSFGQNVHQCVFAGGRFARREWARPRLEYADRRVL